MTSEAILYIFSLLADVPWGSFVTHSFLPQCEKKLRRRLDQTRKLSPQSIHSAGDTFQNDRAWFSRLQERNSFNISSTLFYERGEEW